MLATFFAPISQAVGNRIVNSGIVRLAMHEARVSGLDVLVKNGTEITIQAVGSNASNFQKVRFHLGGLLLGLKSHLPVLSLKRMNLETIGAYFAVLKDRSNWRVSNLFGPARRLREFTLQLSAAILARP